MVEERALVLGGAGAEAALHVFGEVLHRASRVRVERRVRRRAPDLVAVHSRAGSRLRARWASLEVLLGSLDDLLDID